MARKNYMADLTMRIGADVSDLKRGMKSAQKGVSSFQRQIQGIGGMMAGAFAANMIKDFAVEAFKLAGVMKGVKMAFDRTGVSIEKMRKATAGTVSDLELMKNVVKASEFGIPLENMATLLKFASVQAQKLGVNVDVMLDSLIGSLSTQSKMRLDNLGISMSSMNAEMKKGKTFAEAAFTLIDEKMVGTTEVAETAATKVMELAASFENLKIKIGEMLSDGGNPFTQWMIDFTNGLSDFLDGTHSIKKAEDGIVKFKNKINDLKTEKIKGGFWTNLFSGTDQMNLDTWQGKIDELEESIKRLKTARGDFDVPADGFKGGDIPDPPDDDGKKKKKKKIAIEDIMPDLNDIPDDALSLMDIILPDTDISSEAIEELYNEINKGIKKGTDESNEIVKRAQDEQIAVRKSAAETELEEFQEKENKKAMMVAAGLQLAMGVMNTLATLRDAQMAQELEAAGDNEKMKDRIQKRYGEKRKKAAIAEALINGALAITNIIASVPGSVLNPAAWAGIAIAGATTLAQVAAISGQKFAEGGVAAGGLAMVGERGKEIVSLPNGARVSSNQDTMKMLSGGGDKKNLADVKIKGEDIYIVWKEYDRKLNNTR